MKIVLLTFVGLLLICTVMFVRETAVAEPTAALVPCVAGIADIYPCKNVNLLAHLSLIELDSTSGNDIWGWTDPQTGKEYALMGLYTGIAFVDVSDPINPVIVGDLPTHNFNSSWRDVKVYSNHAYIVSEAPAHGMQIFDLTQLRNVVNPPQIFSETAYYDGFGDGHNIVINENSAFAYAVGTNTCDGGLHMVNIQNPISPTFAGCFSSDGYTHDAQCVNYHGPDTDYNNSEICFNANVDTLTLVDVTDKNNPAMIARKEYDTGSSRYAHQGWLTTDHTYFLLGDEDDERVDGNNTRTYIWDVSDLDNPILVAEHTADTLAIDHNLYVHDGLAYQANYRAGLRILDLENIAEGNLTEIAYFDTYPPNDNPNFNGAWSVYPYFDSGTIIVSDINEGLFILQRDMSPPTPTPTPTPTITPTPTSTPTPPNCNDFPCVYLPVLHK